MALNKKMKLATVSAVALGVASLAADAQAQSAKLTANATVTVDNSFDLTETTIMNFGTVVAICDTAANSATLTISPAGALGTVPAGAAKFIVVNSANATQGVFDVANAAPSTALNVSYANTAALACTAGCSGNQPSLALSAITDDTTAGVTTTSNAGALTFNVGGTLTTTASCANQYEDGVYKGTFDVTVAY